MTTVVINPSGLRPVLIDFQNSRIKPGEEHNLRCTQYTSGKEDKPLVGITSNKMLYTGQVRDDEFYNNCLLIRNRKTGKIKLVQIDHCTVRPVFLKDCQMNTSVASPSKSSVLELNKQFGSKRTKRLTEQRERLTMNIEAVKDRLLETVIGINISKTAIDSNLSENDSIYRPKINRDASSRDGVYNLEDLVPFRVLSTLENDALAVINMGLSEELSQFVSSSILKILNSGIAPPVMLRKITIFLYIHYLIKFINTPMKHVTKKFVICEKSAEVNNHILDNFSVNSQNGRTRPVHIKDKSLCFIVVLAAIAMDYEVDLANLSKDCKIGVKKALEISRILAFNASSKNKTVVTLNLPLPAPVTFNPKRKRK